jgi:excinuclease ABC subunit C
MNAYTLDSRYPHGDDPPPLGGTITDLAGPPTEVRRRLGQLPDGPGVYLFRDSQERILYVGKSIHLRQRVRSYFQSGAEESRKQRRLRHEACSLAWIPTGSELEALLLESRLVKRHLPRFNVLLRNYRNYPFIRVDLAETYPRLEVTRVLQRDEAQYFGPFSGAGAIERVVETISDALKLRTCEASGPALQGLRPCLRLDFGRCDAPCIHAVDREHYRQAIEQACRLFEGQAEPLFDLLQGRLEQAAERLQFELAARLRDAIRDIRRLVGKQQALLSAVRNLNLIAVCPARQARAVDLFLFSAGRLLEQREIELIVLDHARRRKALVRQLMSRYSDFQTTVGTRVEQEVVDQIKIVSDWLRRRRGEGHHLVLPEFAADERAWTAIGAWLKEAAVQVAGGRPSPASARSPGAQLQLMSGEGEGAAPKDYPARSLLADGRLDA